MDLYKRQTASGAPVVVFVFVPYTDSTGFIMLLCDTGVIFIISLSIHLHVFLFDKVGLSSTEDINLMEGLSRLYKSRKEV